MRQLNAVADRCVRAPDDHTMSMLSIEFEQDVVQSESARPDGLNHSHRSHVARHRSVTHTHIHEA